MSDIGEVQDQLALVEFAANPDPRCPCVLVLDTSGSMDGEPIEALNMGLQAFQDDIRKNTLAQRRVEVAIVAFNNDRAELVQDFVTAGQFDAPELRAGGSTPLGAAVNLALDMIRERKATYKACGIAYYRPWIFLITDGHPTDEWQLAARRIHDEENAKRVAFFAIGVEGADLNALKQLSMRPPMKLRGLAFSELFVWLSQSQQRVSSSRPEDQVALPPPGWAAV